MGILKKKSADEFRVPSLAEASPEYAALLARQRDLQRTYDELQMERRRLRREIEDEQKAGKQRISAGVARLLGDPEESVVDLSKLFRENTNEIGRVESALGIIQGRLNVERGRASSAVCAAVKPEYARRVVAIAKALEAVDAARGDYEDMRNQLDAEGVSWGSLFPLSLGFLGSYRNGHVQQFIIDNRRAGYVN